MIKYESNQLGLFPQPDNPAYTGRTKSGRKKPKANGYVAQPGTGPEGETCGTCDHRVVRQCSRNYHKCELINYTCGPATDIRVRSPACHRWEPFKKRESDY